MKSLNTAGISVGAGVLVAAVAALADDVDQFSGWSAPVSVGPPVNTEFGELCPSVSKDGRSLYFFSNRPDGFGSNDIWVSQRADSNDPWGQPQNLGSTINTPFDDSAVWLSLDGHRLFFTSDRPGGFGGLDLYVSRRQNKRDDFGWGTPQNLGAGVNSPANELSPSHFEDGETGVVTLYFASNRPGGSGADDIYASTLNGDEDGESFGPAVFVRELSTPGMDRIPGPRRDGLEMFITSNRPGGSGDLDLWVATRTSTLVPWSIPTNAGSAINTVAIDGCGRLSFDGTVLYFHSTRLGGFPLFDLFISTRDKVDNDDD